MSSWKTVNDWFVKYTDANTTSKVVVDNYPVTQTTISDIKYTNSFTYPSVGRPFHDDSWLHKNDWSTKYKHNLEYDMGVAGPQGSSKDQTSAAYFAQTDLHKENQTLKTRIQVLEDKNVYLLKKNIDIESVLADALKLIEKFAEKNKFVNSVIKKIEELLIEEEENENNTI